MEKELVIMRLNEQISKLKKFEFDDWFTPNFEKWYRDTKIDIKNIFKEKSTEKLKEFGDIGFEPQSPRILENVYYAPGLKENFPELKERMIMLLKSIKDEICRYWPNDKQNTSRKEEKLEVFLVHGHDKEKLYKVERFLKQLNIQTIILHDQPTRSKTIIEKLEKHSDTHFAVIILTPDDVGAEKNDKDNIEPRARQNVIFELGFFIGKLGRENTCALYSTEMQLPKIDLPTDFVGIGYIPFDDEWQMALSKELKDAGFEIELNRAIKLKNES